MKPILTNWLFTGGVLLATAGLGGASGSYYLVTTAGLPHFILGFVFAALSARFGRPERRRTLGILGVVSLVACMLYARFPVFDVVGAYFVVHMFRDEVFMYISRRAAHDPEAVAAAGSEKGAGPVLDRAWLAGRIFMLVALAAFLVGRLSVLDRVGRSEGVLTDRALHLTGSVPLDLTLGGIVLGLLTLLALTPRRGFALLHLPPESRGFLALFLTVAFVAHLREATLFLALYHYVSWYLFYGEKLRARAATPQAASMAPTGFWKRAMSRPRPFATLMLAGNLASVGLLALYLQLPETLSVLQYGFEYDYFPYWTIPHVTLSFLPRR